MKRRNKLGLIISLVFNLLAFALACYDIFSHNSGVTHATGAWFTGLLTLLAVVFTFGMLSAKSVTPGVLNILCIITAGIFTIFLGMYWILICLLISLIGCVMHKASRAL